MTSTRDRVFVSYSHEDRQHFAEFRRHLELLSRSTGIRVWTDEDLQAGDDFDAEIQRHLAETALAVFLVSPDALNSDYIGARELPALIRAHENGETIRLTCLHVAPTNSSNLRLPHPNGNGATLDLDLSRFQALNDPKAPVAQVGNRADRDAIYASAARRIASALESANRRDPTPGPAGETTRRRSLSRAALIVGVALALAAAGTTYWWWSSKDSTDPSPPAANPDGKEESETNEEPDQPQRADLIGVLDAYSFADRSKQRSMAENAKEWDELLKQELGSMKTYEDYVRLVEKVEATRAANPSLWDASEDPITTRAPKLASFFNERSNVRRLLKDLNWELGQTALRITSCENKFLELLAHESSTGHKSYRPLVNAMFRAKLVELRQRPSATKAVAALEAWLKQP
ncbi:MAG: toll/interleukin-1 receptor domain-containing protein [bacterium]|nr:toll/interleukin-1 receptor domain-containing protein [bacterium]